MNSRGDWQRPRHSPKAREEQRNGRVGTGHGRAREVNQKYGQKRCHEEMTLQSPGARRKPNWSPRIGTQQREGQRRQENLQRRSTHKLLQGVNGDVNIGTRTRCRSRSRSRSRFRSRGRVEHNPFRSTARDQQEAKVRSQEPQLRRRLFEEEGAHEPVARRSPVDSRELERRSMSERRKDNRRPRLMSAIGTCSRVRGGSKKRVGDANSSPERSTAGRPHRRSRSRVRSATKERVRDADSNVWRFKVSELNLRTQGLEVGSPISISSSSQRSNSRTSSLAMAASNCVPAAEASPHLSSCGSLARSSRKRVRGGTMPRDLAADSSSSSSGSPNSSVERATKRPRHRSPEAVRPAQQTDQSEELEIYRRRCGIAIKRISSSAHRPLPMPLRDIRETPFSGHLRGMLEQRGVFESTIVQSQTWPVVFEGSSLVGVTHRRCGNGKSLAYVLAGIHHVLGRRPLPLNGGPIALIVVPGREVALKIAKTVSAYAAPPEIRALCLVGSEEGKPQNYDDQAGFALMVSTPSDLMRSLEDPDPRLKLSLRQCTYLVVDGADRMLASGFGEQLCRILGQAHDDVQLLVWTVDWSPALKLFIRRTMRDYVKIVFGRPEAEERVVIPARHRVEIVRQEEKEDMLFGLLDRLSKAEGNILIHTKSQSDVTHLVACIGRCMPCLGLHAGKSQLERAQVFRDLRTKTSTILVVTHVRWRGFELPDFKYVINYDFPVSMGQFTHLLSRAGTTGETISYITRDDGRQAGRLVDFMRAVGEEIDPRLLDLAKDYTARHNPHTSRRIDYAD